MKKRCAWVNLNNVASVQYHDNEWCEPVHDDKILFEFLVLESAQAGLSWETILNKRENYRKAYQGFDPLKISKFSAEYCKKLLADSGIIRNKKKIESSITNAQAFLKIQKEFGTFDKYIWSFVNNKPIHTHLENRNDYPVSNTLSKKISIDLKKRGFTFIGPVIIFSFLEGVGILNNHEKACFKSHRKVQ